MTVARYFLPEHPKLTDVYSKSELRGMLQRGELSRSDMVTDDETGKAYLLGDLLMMPFPDVAVAPTRSTTSLQAAIPSTHEFRADTPLPQGEREELREDEDEDEALDDEQEEAQWQEEEDFEEAAATGMPGQRAVAERTPQKDEDDREQEEYLYVGHPSWLAFPKSLFVAVVCLGSAVYFYQHNVRWEWITLPGSITGLILLFISLGRSTTTYLVTTRRVEMEFGIIGRNTKEVRICDIRAIDVVQRGFDAVVGLGTVKFDSSASAGPEVWFRNVRRPHDIKQMVRELQD